MGSYIINRHRKEGFNEQLMRRLLEVLAEDGNFPVPHVTEIQEISIQVDWEAATIQTKQEYPEEVEK